MTRAFGGTKRGSWLTFRRRLLLVRLLLREAMTVPQLIEAVQQELGDEGYPAAAHMAVKHDFDALRREYGCEIKHERSTGKYQLNDLGELALLDLPDTSLEALAFLETSFGEQGSLPEHSNITELLEHILMLLPSERRDHYRNRRGTLSLHFGGKPSTTINRQTLSVVRRAIKERRELQFSYQGLADDRPRLHRVAPYGVFFRTEGHGYLDATVLAADPPGPEAIHSAIDYRLDRIIGGTALVLPSSLPPVRIPVPTYALRYTLLPSVARRRDVATYFPDTSVSYEADGSATITATVTNLWQTRQTLLRYGPACEVREPPELVALMRETARGLAELYDKR